MFVSLWLLPDPSVSAAAVHSPWPGKETTLIFLYINIRHLSVSISALIFLSPDGQGMWADASVSVGWLDPSCSVRIASVNLQITINLTVLLASILGYPPWLYRGSYCLLGLACRVCWRLPQSGTFGRPWSPPSRRPLWCRWCHLDSPASSYVSYHQQDDETMYPVICIIIIRNP